MSLQLVRKRSVQNGKLIYTVYMKHNLYERSPQVYVRIRVCKHALRVAIPVAIHVRLCAFLAEQLVAEKFCKALGVISVAARGTNNGNHV